MSGVLHSHWSRFARIHIVVTAMCILAMVVSPVSANDSWNEVGIIVDYGDGRITWVWVPFEESELAMIEALNRSELDMVTVGFGGLGEGICQIDNTGCPAADCRTRLCQTSSSSPFWRFLKLNGEEWSMVGSGVSGTKAADGDVYALSWSATTPELPIVSIDEIAQNAGANHDASAPVSAMHTDGESATPEASSPSAWAPAAGALGLVVAAAGVLVLRSRVTHKVAA